ncbi:beta-fructofuranosidase, cell wall isozyme-like isoform X1 [Vicia villosa]|uniref:beta-fructofuranosidase, cell wall isozyme-like isoform X1 n=1 Tax=Vicia villosa TaxID=3911 RepID=UPI00273BBE5C|nr:beta-fructofuranosidase, cell wall isozyme-like isoform X1 [Vicia villosa]
MRTSWLLSKIFFLILYGVVHIEAFHQTHSSTFNLNQTYKPSFHFQPSKNWMNDPNGPMRYKGLYHIFYQHNPKGATWSNTSIVWGHSVSKDLVNWFSLPHALTPTKPYDINGCWSGSITFLSNNKPTILYTGIDKNNHQTQNLAIPKNASDPFLKEWIKSPKNPLMVPTISNKINATSFRDPTTAWIGHHDGFWRVLVGSQEKGNKGITLLFKSKDFINWVEAKTPFYSAKKIGMMECPDFFPMLINGSINYGIRHVLKVSLFDVAHDYYLIGTYDTVKDVFIPNKGFEENNNEVLRYDYGKFYASKTFYDGVKKRRVLWGWVNESSIQEDDVQKGWSGIQAIPRTIWLDKFGKQLIQWPIVEIEKLRTKPFVNLHSKVLKGRTLFEISDVTAAQADVEISFEVNDLEKAQALDPSWKMDPQHLCSENGAKAKETGLGPFGLLVLASKDMQEYTRIFFKVFRANKKHVVLMCSDQSRSSLNHKNDLTTYGAFVDVNPLYDELSIRTLIDHSVVESFGGQGKACITSRVYPTLAINDKAHLHVFNNGTVDVKIKKLSAWSMKKAKINEIY